MEARRRTWFDERGLIVAPTGDGGTERALPFYSGAMHYWRVAPARWAACLRAMHELGLTIVETYVPWRVHEAQRGKLDWSGELALPRFLDTARAAGLAVVIRPGPHINAELTCFGFPDHVVGDSACQARSARGTPVWMPSPPRAWPVPSYASKEFRSRVRAWYGEVAKVVTPHLAPDGPIVAIGVDNEAQMFFRLGAYDHDYHPDAIAWWHEAGGEGDPPKAWSPADPARCAAWVRFKDQYLARCLGEFAGMLDEVGLGGVARFHNLPPTHRGLYDLRAIQSVIGGPVGIDAYTARSDFRDLRRRGLAMTGNAAPVPIAFEVGVGFFPWFPPLDLGTKGDDPTRERDHLLTLLASGTRGFNLFMTVERDRYYGAAISDTGRVEPHAAWIKSLLAALAAIDWPSLRRVPAPTGSVPIALVEARTDARFGIATSAVDVMTPVLVEALQIGPAGAAELGDDTGAIASRRWQTAITDALELAQVPYAIVDESATAAELAQHRAVIVPTIDRIDRALWQRLRTLAEAKKTIVVIGPGTPVRDELDNPLDEPVPRRVGRLKAGSLEDLAGLAADLVALAGELPDTWAIERPDHVRAFAYAADLDASGGDVRVVFVANDAPKPTTAILLADSTRLRDPFTHEVIEVADGRASIALGALGVRMLLVE